MFSAPVILLLDEQIERLQKARDILASLVEPVTVAVPSSIVVPSRRQREAVIHTDPVTQAAVGDEAPPHIVPAKVRVPRARREPRRETPAAGARALGGMIPNRPVVVLAGALSKPEGAAVPEHKTPSEDHAGTLDALVRELTERRVHPAGNMLS